MRRIFDSMVNMRFFSDYAKHIIVSRNRHGVHSPFVYALLDEVIYQDASYPYYKTIETLRNRLKQDQRKIKITDLGAGSKLNTRQEKRVAQLAKNALKPARIAQLIARIAGRFKPEVIIELGTCLGITTAYMASASPESEVISVEGCPETAKIARENFDMLNLQNISLQVGNFDQQLPEILDRYSKLDFLFIDGNHRKDATLTYFKQCLPKIHENTILIFDDIYWSQGMKEAWEEIKAHPKVQVSMDLFYIGLVFFKTDQAKEHFKIRFY